MYDNTDIYYRMEQWMRALTCAGYEYMKLMVAELQRQLNEIERSKGKYLLNALLLIKCNRNNWL